MPCSGNLLLCRSVSVLSRRRCGANIRTMSPATGAYLRDMSFPGGAKLQGQSFGIPHCKTTALAEKTEQRDTTNT